MEGLDLEKVRKDLEYCHTNTAKIDYIERKKEVYVDILNYLQRKNGEEKEIKEMRKILRELIDMETEFEDKKRKKIEKNKIENHPNFNWDFYKINSYCDELEKLEEQINYLKYLKSDIETRLTNVNKEIRKKEDMDYDYVYEYYDILKYTHQQVEIKLNYLIGVFNDNYKISNKEIKKIMLLTNKNEMIYNLFKVLVDKGYLSKESFNLINYHFSFNIPESIDLNNTEKKVKKMDWQKSLNLLPHFFDILLEKELIEKKKGLMVSIAEHFLVSGKKIITKRPHTESMRV